LHRSLLVLWKAVRAAIPIVILVGVVALAQDPVASPVPAVVQTAPVPPWAWVLDLGAPGVLLGVLIKLWTYFQKKDVEHQAEKTSWGTEKVTLKAACAKEVSDLKVAHEKELDRVWVEARKDKGELRVSFETEKQNMSVAYTEEIKALQAKLDSEQQGSLKQTEKLLREQNVLTREVMNTAQAMSASLNANTLVTEKLVENTR